MRKIYVLMTLLALFCYQSHAQTIQAETANTQSGVSIASNQSGANGGDYLDFGGNGTYAQWNVSYAAGTTADIVVRYSAGSGTRGLKLTVGGVDKGSKTLTNTANWDTWRTVTWSNVTLNAGGTIRLTAVGQGPNVDEFVINSTSGGSTGGGNTGGGSGGGNSGGSGSSTSCSADHTQQAEVGSTRSGVGISSNQSGSNGGQYLDYGGNGTYAQWSVNYTAGSTVDVVIRYSAGSGTRGLKLTVNGTDEGNKNLPNTANWNTWSTITWSDVPMNATNTIRLTAVGSGPNVDEFVLDCVSGGSNSGSSGGTGGSDTQAPSRPTGLSTSNITSSSATLSWSASSDNVGVTGYDLYRGNTLVKSNHSSTSYTFTGLSASTTYSLKVRARDAAGNTSAEASRSITTASNSGNSGGGGSSTSCSADHTQQAEVGSTRSGVGISSNQSGSNGGQYLDYGGDGTYAQWSVNYTAGSTVDVVVRYSAGSGTRGLNLTVNGANEGTKTLPNTANWNTWSTVTWNDVPMNATNTIRLTAVGAGPNVDEFVLDCASGGSGGGSGGGGTGGGGGSTGSLADADYIGTMDDLYTEIFSHFDPGAGRSVGNGQAATLSVNSLRLGSLTTMPSGSVLAVKGDAIMEVLHVARQQAWPDYVFAQEYHLMPLEELRSYISLNKHLPKLPSAKEVEEQGHFSLGKHQVLLLEKLEELTLYSIQLEEQKQDLKAELEAQAALLNELEALLKVKLAQQQEK
ncbi:MAG: carbohydrate-binding protein [Flammeovirgaceae bacterium]